MNNGTLPEFTPKQAPLKADFWVTPRERRAVERARRLARAGWLEEAQSELRALPKPDSPEQAALLAGLFAQVGGYTSAFRLMNEAWDAMRELRREPFLRWVFPEEFQALIQSWSAQRRLNPEVVRSLMKQESAFSPQAVSVAPAYGLMQIIVPTGREIASEIGLKDLAWPDALMDPQRNVQMGTHYLAKLLNKYKGHVPLALAAYNAGPTRVDRYLRGRPALAELMTRPGSSPLDEIWFDELPIEETSIYIKSILRNMIIYRALRGERTGWAPILWQTPSVEQGS
jgi:soluble lytic murein transglycosylase